ncbi:MAG: RNA methyltransferase [Puniceicoccales bacterium]|jgi:TrmH family RNA methyltransferase|nr:RNA methyltransferase [Puniceicoccales bacterium]
MRIWQSTVLAFAALRGFVVANFGNPYLMTKNNFTGCISSRQNPNILWVATLRKPERRREEGFFAIEGRREVLRALDNNFSVKMIFLINTVSFRAEHIDQVFRVTPEVFAKISCRQNPDGILAVAELPKSFLPVQLPNSALVLIAEGLEKPGNLGAIIRTAEAAGCDLVIFADPLTDPWNPNVIRASQGAIFGQNIACCSNDEALLFLNKNNIPIVATVPDAQRDYWDAFFSDSLAIAVGNEHHGLSKFWLKNANLPVRIPMCGDTSDSLNVGIAAALCLYEFRRTHPYK